MDALNGLQGLAAIWVMLFHIFAGRIQELKVLSPVWGYRRIVVDLQGCSIMPLFFVLSGFRLAAVEGRTLYRLVIYGGEVNGEDFDKKRFYIKRFARVMPGFYLSTVFALPLLWMGFGPLDPSDMKSLIGTLITNIVPLNTILNCQLPPWPVDTVYDSADSTTWYNSPILLKNINGPAWTIATLGWFWIAFPFIFPRIQRWTDCSLFFGITGCFWVQMALMHAFFWPMEAYEVGGLKYWRVAPGDPAFNWAALNPISRLPVFIMGMLAGLLCLRHANENGLVWPTRGFMIFPPAFISSVPRTALHQELPRRERELGIYSQIWWAKMTDRTAAFISIIFGVEIVIDTYVMNFMHKDQKFPQGLAGSIWLQGLVPYAFLSLCVGLTRDGGQSWCAKLCRKTWMKTLGNISFSIYLLHFPLIEYLVWMQGSEPACYEHGKPTSYCTKCPDSQASNSTASNSTVCIPDLVRHSFGMSHANWGANDPLVWECAIVVVIL